MQGSSLVPVIIALLTTKEVHDSYNSKFIKGFVGACTAVWFILILPFQFMPSRFMYETDKSKLNYKELIDVQFARYAIGDQNENGVLKQFFSPTQLNIIKTLNRDKEARVLNVSTFLNYFIENNDRRVFKDNQLGIFNDIYFHANNDRKQFAKELKKNKIKYILVSLKTASIDRTPDKSLTRKFDNLMRAMVNNPEVQLLYTNRIVERPDGDMQLTKDGLTVTAKYDVVGKRVLDPGTDALFEIL